MTRLANREEWKNHVQRITDVWSPNKWRIVKVREQEDVDIPGKDGKAKFEEPQQALGPNT
jgi:hypothetical protein